MSSGYDLGLHFCSHFPDSSRYLRFTINNWIHWIFYNKYPMSTIIAMYFVWFCTLIHCPDPKFALSPMIIELLILWYPSNIFLSKAMLAPPSASLKFVISAVVARVFALYFRFLYPIWKFHVCAHSCMCKKCLIIYFLL